MSAIIFDVWIRLCILSSFLYLFFDCGLFRGRFISDTFDTVWWIWYSDTSDFSVLNTQLKHICSTELTTNDNWYSVVSWLCRTQFNNVHCTCVWPSYFLVISLICFLSKFSQEFSFCCWYPLWSPARVFNQILLAWIVVLNKIHNLQTSVR